MWFKCILLVCLPLVVLCNSTTIYQDKIMSFDPNFLINVTEICYSIHDSTIQPDDRNTKLHDVCLQNKTLKALDMKTVCKGSFDDVGILLIPQSDLRSVELLFRSKSSHAFNSLRIYNSETYQHVEENGKFFRGFPFLANKMYFISINSSPTPAISIAKILPSKIDGEFSYAISDVESERIRVSCSPQIHFDDINSVELKIRGEGPSNWFLFQTNICDKFFMVEAIYKIIVEILFSDLSQNLTTNQEESFFNTVDTLHLPRTHKINSSNVAHKGEHNLIEKSHSPMYIAIAVIALVGILVFLGFTIVKKFSSEKECNNRANTYEAESSLHITESQFYRNDGEGGCTNVITDTERSNNTIDKLSPNNDQQNPNKEICKAKLSAKLSTIDEQTSEKDSSKVDIASLGSLDDLSLKTKSPMNGSKNNLLNDELSIDGIDAHCQELNMNENI